VSPERRAANVRANRELAKAIRAKLAALRQQARSDAPPAMSPAELDDLTTGPTAPADWAPVRRRGN
jgi:hypothetical protein